MIARRTALTNCRTIANGEVLGHAVVAFEDGVITYVGEDDAPVEGTNIDMRGEWVLPGIVDVHCESLLRHVAPRGTRLQSAESAEQCALRECHAAGVTSPVFTVNATLEPDLMSISVCESLVNHVRTHMHLRIELSAAAEVPQSLLRHPRVALVGINNHAPNELSRWDEHKYLRYVRRRSTLTSDDERALLEAARISTDEWIARAATTARDAQVPVCFHDLAGRDLVDWCVEHGVGIAEFAVDGETARYAVSRGMTIVLGAPNVVRGGSHNGQLDASSAVAEAMCHCLCSDYYVDALWQAPFHLQQRCGLPFARAWSLVSSAPATVLGWSDRGRIAVGQRADLVAISGRPLAPLATWCQGELKYASAPLVQWLVEADASAACIEPYCTSRVS